MKQLLSTLIVGSAIVCLATPASASLPLEKALSIEPTTLISETPAPTDTMLAQCYGGGGYYAPVYRSTYYAPRRSGVNVSFGRGFYGGGRGFYNGYRGFGPGFGPGFGYGPGFGRGFGRGFGGSGVGLFLSF